MNAGRDLDILIAEKLFGHKSYDLPTERPPTATEGIMREARLISLPHYSTDIRAAWRVIKKVNEGVSQPYIRRFSIVLDERGWIAGVEWFSNEDGWMFYDKWGRSDSAPHAICLAALKISAHPQPLP